MSRTILLNDNWHFIKENHGLPGHPAGETVTLPHTWNAQDGQDGGNDYYRGTCWYTRKLPRPEVPDGGRAVLEFDGAAMTAEVWLNGEKLASHAGGFSAFRVDITDALREENLLAVSVDNSDNRTVYPQKADFTFYGGIYRDVKLHLVPHVHFALPANGAPALKVTPVVTSLDKRTAEVTVEALASVGIRLLYHNHNVELTRVNKSRRVYDILIEETDPGYVNFEFDSYWFAEGGADPLSWMRRLGSRMKLWHINDRGARLTGTAMTPILSTDSMELGTGNMPLDALMEQALSVDVGAVVLESHKNWIDKSPVKSLQISAEYLKGKVK